MQAGLRSGLPFAELRSRGSAKDGWKEDEMATTTRVKVLRPLNGDDGKGGSKRYERGDYRTMDPADANRLAETGAVEIVKTSKKAPVRQAKKARGAKPASKVKAAPKPKNKAAPKPANKSAS